jgi:hypothetical protein
MMMVLVMVVVMQLRQLFPCSDTGGNVMFDRYKAQSGKNEAKGSNGDLSVFIVTRTGGHKQQE